MISFFGMLDAEDVAVVEIPGFWWLLLLKHIPTNLPMTRVGGGRPGLTQNERTTPPIKNQGTRTVSNLCRGTPGALQPLVELMSNKKESENDLVDAAWALLFVLGSREEQIHPDFPVLDRLASIVTTKKSCAKLPLKISVMDRTTSFFRLT
jgi:hypothetical protein